MPVKMRHASAQPAAAAVGRGQVLRAAIAAVAATGLAAAAAPRAAEAAYIPGTGSTPDRVDRNLQVEGRLDVQAGKLFVSGTQPRVGVNHGAPDYPLHVYSDQSRDVQLYLEDDSIRGGIRAGADLSLQGHAEAENGYRSVLLAGCVYYSSVNHRYELLPGGAGYGRQAIELLGDNSISFKAEEQDRSAQPYMSVAEWDSTERMRITACGNVGIGTSIPCQRLDVEGNARVNGTIYAGSTRIADEGGCYYAP
jgi:hypothetical protein